MSAISDKVYVHADGVGAITNGHYLTSDQDACVDYRRRLGLE